MLKSRIFWIAALWVGSLVHVDWHLGRSGHDHRSFDLAYHWLVALPTFVPVAWIAVRTWPASALQAVGGILGVGIIIGQALEPLSEVILFSAGPNPLLNRDRWIVFGQFIVAGIVTSFGSVFVLSRSLHPSPPGASPPADRAT